VNHENDIKYYFIVLMPSLKVHIIIISVFTTLAQQSNPVRLKNFLFSASSRPALGLTQPPIQCVPVVKRPRRESDCSALSSVEVDVHMHSPIRVDSILLN
jgi:hypothetical protein